MTQKQLYVELIAKLDKYYAGIDAATARLDTFSKQTIENNKKQENSWNSSFGVMIKGYLGFEAVLASGRALKNLVLLEERFNSMQMPLRGLTQESGGFGQAMLFNKTLADQYGQSIFTLGEEYKNLYATSTSAGLSLASTNAIYKSLIVSGAGLKLSNESISLSMRAITQMIDKQNISSEELKGQLAEHIPGAYGLMAKAAKDAGLSVTGSTQELAKLLEQGKLASNVVLPYFAKRMEEAFGKNANENVKTISGSANRMTNELTYLIDALDQSKVTGFWAAMQNGIADVFKDLTFMTKSGSFRDFMNYMTGQGATVTGMRIATEVQDQNFAEKSPKEQAKQYRELNLRLAENVKISRDLLKSGITPNTEGLTKLANQVKRYKELMTPVSGGGGGVTPPLVGKGHVKEVQDYAFEIALLEVEIKRGAAALEEWANKMKLADMRKMKFTPDSMTPTQSRSADLVAKDKGLIESLFGDDLVASSEKLKAKFEVLKQNMDTELQLLGDAYNTKLEFIQGSMTMATEFLGSSISNAFASIFSQKIDFQSGFRQLLGGFLSGLGDMVMKMAMQLKLAATIKALAEKALMTLGGGTIALGAAVGMFALGAAMKGGGMALSASSSNAMVSNNASNGPSYNNSSPSFGGWQSQKIDIKVTGELKGQGTELIGVFNNTQRVYNG